MRPPGVRHRARTTDSSAGCIGAKLHLTSRLCPNHSRQLGDVGARQDVAAPPTHLTPTASAEGSSLPRRHQAPGLTPMRAVQITRVGGPEVLDVVDIPEPEAGPGQKLYEISTAGINYADTHHRLHSALDYRSPLTYATLNT